MKRKEVSAMRDPYILQLVYENGDVRRTIMENCHDDVEAVSIADDSMASAVGYRIAKGIETIAIKYLGDPLMQYGAFKLVIHDPATKLRIGTPVRMLGKQDTVTEIRISHKTVSYVTASKKSFNEDCIGHSVRTL